MGELIQRMARAMCVADGISPDLRVRSGASPMLILGKPYIVDDGRPRMEAWLIYRHAAVIALQTIREPTEAMVAAAYAALDTYDISQSGACTVTHAHQAMVDLELKDA